MQPRSRDAESSEGCIDVALSERRGRRECRVLAATHGPRAVKKHGEGTTGSAESSGIPCAMGYGLYVISPGTGLVCPRHRADVISTTWHQRRGVRTTRLHRPQMRVRLTRVHVHRVPLRVS